tara:strand:+ start:1322 stop:1939 length:618 start_codon:yes stop_codon:yes gene_type:complete
MLTEISRNIFSLLVEASAVISAVATLGIFYYSRRALNSYQMQLLINRTLRLRRILGMLKPYSKLDDDANHTIKRIFLLRPSTPGRYLNEADKEEMTQQKRKVEKILSEQKSAINRFIEQLVELIEEINMLTSNKKLSLPQSFDKHKNEFDSASYRLITFILGNKIDCLILNGKPNVDSPYGETVQALERISKDILDAEAWSFNKK